MVDFNVVDMVVVFVAVNFVVIVFDAVNVVVFIAACGWCTLRSMVFVAVVFKAVVVVALGAEVVDVITVVVLFADGRWFGMLRTTALVVLLVIFEGDGGAVFIAVDIAAED